jgi:Family of unknown function (DUF6338)
MEEAGTPTTLGAVVILVAFLPGFVTVLLQERTFRSADDPTSHLRILRIVWYSAWSYVFWAIVALIVGSTATMSSASTTGIPQIRRSWCGAVPL